MLDNQKVEEVIKEAIAAEGAFLVDYSMGSDRRITVHADHIEGITLEKLGKISRVIEQELNRDENDFELEVSSPGLGQPFKVAEQYTMNVGRDVKVTLNDGTVHQGKMKSIDDGSLTLTWETREPKPVGKGKITVEKEETISLTDIKETRLEIKF